MYNKAFIVCIVIVSCILRSISGVLHESQDILAEELVDALLNRVLKVLPTDATNLCNTTVAKAYTPNRIFSKQTLSSSRPHYSRGNPYTQPRFPVSSPSLQPHLFSLRRSWPIFRAQDDGGEEGGGGFFGQLEQLEVELLTAAGDCRKQASVAITAVQLGERISAMSAAAGSPEEATQAREEASAQAATAAFMAVRAEAQVAEVASKISAAIAIINATSDLSPEKAEAAAVVAKRAEAAMQFAAAARAKAQECAGETRQEAAAAAEAAATATEEAEGSNATMATEAEAEGVDTTTAIPTT
eukprot:gnl/MRDRNA2_/MRDRNA2_39200_c0_seq1.p1 gnl/MRDRNA2_/MRDRNA2_39200_c0~~gnl/MRDRNA2_/MRDRNA2_39200_c0_seq1.p1  ORF type:complete len:300 (+),score=69.58 gnl/MRDRNA2_/MRDRNA2_39200_c0_seq1:61-960(+)